MERTPAEQPSPAETPKRRYPADRQLEDVGPPCPVHGTPCKVTSTRRLYRWYKCREEGCDYTTKRKKPKKVYPQ